MKPAGLGLPQCSLGLLPHDRTGSSLKRTSLALAGCSMVRTLALGPRGLRLDPQSRAHTFIAGSIPSERQPINVTRSLSPFSSPSHPLCLKKPPKTKREWKKYTSQARILRKAHSWASPHLSESVLEDESQKSVLNTLFRWLHMKVRNPLLSGPLPGGPAISCRYCAPLPPAPLPQGLARWLEKVCVRSLS